MAVPFARARALLVALAIGAPVSAVAQQNSSLTLAALLDRVRTGHPRLGAAEARVAAAQGARRAAGVFPNPVLGFNLENASIPGRNPALGMDREDMLSATLPLEFAYQRGSRVRGAAAELDAARAEGTAERQRTALAALRAYYRAALAQVDVGAAEDLAGWLDSLVAYNRRRVTEGALGEADLLRAELERDRVLAELSLQRAISGEALAQLQAFAGDSGWTGVSLPNAPLALPDGPSATRAELLAARARLAAAGAGVGVARSMLIRDLSGMAGLKWSAGSTTLLAGVSLPLPLLDQNRGDIARAHAQESVANFELTAATREAQAELTAASEAHRLLTERVAAMRGAGGTIAYLSRADEMRRITLGAFQEGATPLFTVLDAARVWAEARTTYYRLLFAQHESVAMLLAARGRDLFSELPPLLPPESLR